MVFPVRYYFTVPIPKNNKILPGECMDDDEYKYYTRMIFIQHKQIILLFSIIWKM